MKLRIYPDTSVFGGVYDTEFSHWSKELFKQFVSGKHIMIVSDMTLLELDAAPKSIRDILTTIPDITYISLQEESKWLADRYIGEKIVTKKYFIDAQHIALASINRVDVLVSWNFKHIVNYNKIRLYNAINMKYGYPLIDIRSPREII